MSQKKPIKSITPFTTLDFPNYLACIVWFSGCNMRCPYCYNPNIVLEKGEVSEDELLAFLNKRVGLLDGVVLSGGECTLYAGLKDLCIRIKSLGFSIKIDTNGSNPKLLQELCKESLVDFVALDFKAPKSKFTHITNSNLYEKFEQSLDFLIECDFAFEARTTLHEDLLDFEDIQNIVDTLHVKGYTHTFCIQHFLETKNLGNLTSSQNNINLEDLKVPFPIELRNF